VLGNFNLGYIYGSRLTIKLVFKD